MTPGNVSNILRPSYARIVSSLKDTRKKKKKTHQRACSMGDQLTAVALGSWANGWCFEEAHNAKSRLFSDIPAGLLASRPWGNRCRSTTICRDVREVKAPCWWADWALWSFNWTRWFIRWNSVVTPQRHPKPQIYVSHTNMRAFSCDESSTPMEKSRCRLKVHRAAERGNALVKCQEKKNWKYSRE